MNWVKIPEHLEQKRLKYNFQAIAKQLRCDPNTVRKYWVKFEGDMDKAIEGIKTSKGAQTGVRRTKNQPQPKDPNAGLNEKPIKPGFYVFNMRKTRDRRTWYDKDPKGESYE
ncbi:MAG: hypothetical protein HKM94_08140 [Halobacteria archaeon]|nr:hypothetical protein [Halobacteria archaeon]